MAAGFEPIFVNHQGRIDISSYCGLNIFVGELQAMQAHRLSREMTSLTNISYSFFLCPILFFFIYIHIFFDGRFAVGFSANKLS